MTFLRPLFLLLLLVPFFLKLIRHTPMAQTIWSKWIDANLLPYLLKQFQHKQSKQTTWHLLTVIWCLWSIALAGPAIQTDVPAYLNTNSTVIVLDLNSTAQTNQLIKVKAKLSDLLNQLNDQQVALVLYDAKGYTVTPLTQDKNILQSLIPTLGGDVLPTAQNKPETGFQTAQRLLDNLNLNDGRILFISGGGFNEKTLANFIRQTPYQTAFLFVPDAPDKTPPLNNIVPTQILTPDESDIIALLNATPLNAQSTISASTNTIAYRDLGIFLLALSIPMMLYLFRKNVLFLICLAFCTPAQANLFFRADQQAYQQTGQAALAFHNKEYQGAHDLFLNTDAAYKTRGDAQYNAATALAFAGQINKAIALYEQVLEQNPTHTDARFNKEYLEKQLPPQNGENGSNNNADNTNNDTAQTDTDSSEQPNQSNENNDESNQNQSNENNPSDTESENSSDENNDTQQNDSSSTSAPDNTDENTDESAQNQSAQNNAPENTNESQLNQQPTTGNETESEQQNNTSLNQETQQLFNRIEEDPSRLLRYRLYQQYRKQP